MSFKLVPQDASNFIVFYASFNASECFELNARDFVLFDTQEQCASFSELQTPHTNLAWHSAGKHVSGLNGEAFKNIQRKMLSCSLSSVERESGGEIYGVSTGEWGAGGTTCHYRNGNGIYRSAAAL